MHLLASSIQVNPKLLVLGQFYYLLPEKIHEFFQVEDNKIVQVQAIWDLPELMMQANAWPMAPQLGAFLCTPSPMTSDGLAIRGDGKKNFDHVINMLHDLSIHPTDPNPRVMQLEKYWHPNLNWYGPAGIGTGRGIAGFRPVSYTHLTLPTKG